jgi:GcrA cell cycle regulator
MTMLTAEQIARAKALWDEGRSAGQIAKAIGGISRSAILGHAHRRGWGGHNSMRSPGKTEKIKAARKSRRRGDGKLGSHIAHQLKRPPAFTPRKVIIPTGAPISLDLTLMELASQHCRWPVGERTGIDQLFCGATKEIEVSYCLWHQDIARGRAA